MGPNNGSLPNFNSAPNPQASNFNVAPNQLPQYNVGPNTTYNSGYNNYNQAPQPVEQAPRAEQMIQQPVIVTATPNPAPTSTPTPDPTAVSSDKPQTAAQLEKEWVDKAKTTISATQSDPYEQAHQVALLMKGYLQKKYGKIIGKTE